MLYAPEEEQLFLLCKLLIRRWHYSKTENGLWVNMSNIVGKMGPLVENICMKNGYKFTYIQDNRDAILDENNS